MVSWILKKILGSKNQRELRRLTPIVRRINELDEQFKSLSDEELRAKTAAWKEEFTKISEPEDQWKKLDEILPEAFAVVKNAARRLKERQHSFTVCDQPMVWDMVHFDVQLLGGVVLHRGRIAEMATGEGKTLVATMPMYLNALAGRGVHLVTVNDYLARRDSEWMGEIFRFLGLTVGCIQNQMEPVVRRRMYECDITYGTNNEFGFDYLRDNMALLPEHRVQRGFCYAIVDEVDSVLIDEARTPLIISGPVEHSDQAFDELKPIVERVVRAQQQLVNQKLDAALKLLDDKEKADEAGTLFEKDVEYVVQDGKVLIVDEFTGRLMPGRRYSEGLHQAIEAKEGVNVEGETQTLATITLQNFFRMYDKLAGMTGTAETEAREFWELYKLDVSVIPTHRKAVRKDHEDVVYRTKREKYNAVIDEIVDFNKRGQPVLVGTISVQVRELVSRM